MHPHLENENGQRVRKNIKTGHLTILFFGKFDFI